MTPSLYIIIQVCKSVVFGNDLTFKVKVSIHFVSIHFGYCWHLVSYFKTTICLRDKISYIKLNCLVSCEPVDLAVAEISTLLHSIALIHSEASFISSIVLDLQHIYINTIVWLVNYYDSVLSWMCAINLRKYAINISKVTGS